MADFGNTVGGFLSGFNSTYFPAIRQNEVMARQKAQDDRANALQQFQMQKYAEAEAKDRQAAGLYAGLLGIRPTKYTPLDGADAEAAGDFMPEVANPQYEQFLAGGAKAGADMVKQTRESELAALKARTDAWKEAQAQRMADIKDKQIMAMIARGQGGGSESKQPVVYIDPSTGRAVYGTIKDARGKEAAGFSPTVVGAKAEATAGGTARGKREYNMEGVGGTIDMARELLNAGPTQSYIGAGGDMVARMAGQSTKGAEIADQLETLAGHLTSKMPRMEGPQSDKDVALYRQMAGSVGDRTLPVERRLASLNMLEHIVSKYDRAPTQGAAPRVRTFNPKTGRLE